MPQRRFGVEGGVALLHACSSQQPICQAVASAAGIISSPEMAPYSIGVTVLCPTFVKTKLLDEMKFTDKFQKHCSTRRAAGLHRQSRAESGGQGNPGT
jgi:hypothetical protein